MEDVGPYEQNFLNEEVDFFPPLSAPPHFDAELTPSPLPSQSIRR